jgi:hypothetical protein
MKDANGNNITEICQHKISWFLRKSDTPCPTKIDETSAEYIADRIREGYNQGALCVMDENENEFHGWWSIMADETSDDPEEGGSEAAHSHSKIKLR